LGCGCEGMSWEVPSHDSWGNQAGGGGGSIFTGGAMPKSVAPPGGCALGKGGGNFGKGNPMADFPPPPPQSFGGKKGGGCYGGGKGGGGGYGKGPVDSGGGKGKGCWGKDSYGKDASFGGTDAFGLVPPSGKGLGGKGTVYGASQFTPAPRLTAPAGAKGGGYTGPPSGCGNLIMPPGLKGGFGGGLAPVMPPFGAPGAGLGSAVSNLGSALAAVAGAAARGAFRPPPGPVRQLVPPGQPPPPPGPAPLALMSGYRPPGQLPPGQLQLALPQTIMPPGGGLLPELAALVFASAAEVDDGPTEGKVTFPPAAPKPKLFLLITRLAPDLEESHLHQILEQCGDLQAFRRGRDDKGVPLSFGFAQFGEPEAAWKASTCLTGLKLCGQELKVLLEEAAENLIAKWRSSQQVALKVSNEEELSWELERKSVSCRSQIDAKVAEIYGGTDESGGAYIAQRKQELREREKSRLERAQKRKSWREAEFDKERSRIESAEKRLRRSERDRDDGDRVKEEGEIKKEDPDMKPKIEGDSKASIEALVTKLADDQQLWKMVDRVQAEPRDDLFKMPMDVSFLRNERVFEDKLRPWLEKRVELCMGGQQSDMVEYIIRRVNSATHPEALMSDLMRYLDDHAEPMVERMWRMLAFELMRGGHVLQEPLKWEN